MIEKDQDPHICYNCDEEFVIHTPYDTEAAVSFCPFCGSEVEDSDIVDEDDFEDFDEEDESF